MLLIENKYSDTSNIVKQEERELKKIDDSLSIFRIMYRPESNLPESFGIRVKTKGNKELIQKLTRYGWKADKKVKVGNSIYPWDKNTTPYYVQELTKCLRYRKWAIFQGKIGLCAVEYVDDEYYLKDNFPYIRPKVLPILVNGYGGYTSFTEDYGNNKFIKIIEILEDDEPLTLTEQYPKNSDDFLFGWIAPNGDTYHCGFEGHSNCADMICKELFPDTYICGAESHLEELGWIKVSRKVPYTPYNQNSRSVYFLSMTRDLTKAQVDTLFKLDLQDDENIEYLIKRVL